MSPVKKKMMTAMKKEYGVKKGKGVYYAMEMKEHMMERKRKKSKRK